MISTRKQNTAADKLPPISLSAIAIVALAGLSSPIAFAGAVALVGKVAVVTSPPHSLSTIGAAPFAVLLGLVAGTLVPWWLLRNFTGRAGFAIIAFAYCAMAIVWVVSYQYRDTALHLNAMVLISASSYILGYLALKGIAVMLRGQGPE